MMQRYKYPRTPHLPNSPGFTNDDVHIVNYQQFEGKDVVITEKMDGESFSCYSDGYFHARSIDSRYHESRSWAMSYLANIAHKIPKGIRICGENLFAKHSIEYSNLESYCLIFGVWDGDICWEWESVKLLCYDLDLATVPVLYEGKFDKKILENIIKKLDTTKQEGIVIRNADRFTYDQFSNNVAKWVRPCHVQSDEHWMHQKIIKNKLLIF